MNVLLAVLLMINYSCSAVAEQLRFNCCALISDSDQRLLLCGVDSTGGAPGHAMEFEPGQITSELGWASRNCPALISVQACSHIANAASTDL